MNLTGAQMEKVDLAYAQLEGANLTGAQLEWTNLTDVWGLTAEQVAAAAGNAWTRLPDDVERPASWPLYDPSAGPPAGGS